MVNTVFIVRHSERIDESKNASEKADWKMLVENDKSQRNKSDLQADPILTTRGLEIASETAKSIAVILENMKLKDYNETQITAAPDLPSLAAESIVRKPAIECVYTSRLRRCIETAYPIALELNVPLLVCTGLALTALAVERRRGLFEFHSMKEISSFCPGVNVISCDNDVCRGFLETLCCCSNSSNSSGSELKKSAGGTPSLAPTESWFDALTNIAVRHPVTVIVAHRESIRNLVSDVGLPGYGHTAVFHHTLHEMRNSDNSNKSIDKSPSAATLNLETWNGIDETVFSFQYMLDESGGKV
jgi:hypothetical protein